MTQYQTLGVAVDMPNFDSFWKELLGIAKNRLNKSPP